MGDFIESASRILSQSQWRLEVSAQNIANGTTPGYKKRSAFSIFPDVTPVTSRETPVSVDFTQGKVVETGAKTDLAILGDGFFVMRGENGTYYSRQGQFQRDSEGRLIGAAGLALQLESGGDVVVKSADFAIDAEGVVLEGGEPIGRLAMVGLTTPQAIPGPAGGLYSAGDGETSTVGRPTIQQGYLEASNVSLGDEMITMMEALRRAESAQRLVNVYDDLMGRAISSFGQA